MEDLKGINQSIIPYMALGSIFISPLEVLISGN